MKQFIFPERRDGQTRSVKYVCYRLALINNNQVVIYGLTIRKYSFFHKIYEMHLAWLKVSYEFIFNSSFECAIWKSNHICINLGSSNENGVYFINCNSKLQKMAYFVSFFVSKQSFQKKENLQKCWDLIWKHRPKVFLSSYGLLRYV